MNSKHRLRNESAVRVVCLPTDFCGGNARLFYRECAACAEDKQDNPRGSPQKPRIKIKGYGAHRVPFPLNIAKFVLTN